MNIPLPYVPRKIIKEEEKVEKEEKKKERIKLEEKEKKKMNKI